MLGFFNTENKTKFYLQLYNTSVILIAAHQLLTDDKLSKAEIGSDILVHALAIHSLRPNAGTFSAFGSFSLNTFRLGSVFTALTTGCSSLSLLANSWDAFTHVLNLVVILDDTEDDFDQTSRSDMAQRKQFG
jgi:hypothetical protein